MPTPSTAKWPKPKSEDEFEDLCVEFVRIRWKDPNADRFGRRGQRQHGVDIIGRPSWAKGRTLAAQCKNTDNLTLSEIVAEVEEAKKFPGGIAEYYVLTSGHRDQKLQADVHKHFKFSPAPFRVELVFWDGITGDVCHDQALVEKYWKGFGALTRPSDAEILASMVQVFDRPVFTTPFHMESSLPRFTQAIDETIKAINTGARRTHDGDALPSIRSRHDLTDPALRSTLQDIEEALKGLRSAFDDFVRRGEIRPCSCTDPKCSTFMMDPQATEDMNQRRRRILDLFRTIHPPFDAYIRDQR